MRASWCGESFLTPTGTDDSLPRERKLKRENLSEGKLNAAVERMLVHYRAHDGSLSSSEPHWR